MRLGLLWFDDNETKPLETKVEEAVAAYRSKPRFADKKPNVCYVHASALPKGKKTVRLNGVRVVASATVGSHCFFVVTESAGKKGKRKKAT
jgi:hypothetical protein